jgi:DNA-binding protein HU-beta
MNKTEMIAKLAEKNGMTKKDAQKALEGLIEIISDEIKDGGSVILTGFGTFSIAERKPRTGRNPQTGQPIDIPAARVPKFKAGKQLKDVVK